MRCTNINNMVNVSGQIEKAEQFKKIYEYFQDEMRILILTDRHNNIFWQKGNETPSTILNMPWRFQIPFYLTFLHDDKLASKYKDMQVLEAIHVYLKDNFMN